VVEAASLPCEPINDRPPSMRSRLAARAFTLRLSALATAVAFSLAVHVARAAPGPDQDRVPATPGLDRLIRAALVSSPLLAARRNDVSAARSDVDAARWQYAPAVSADLQQGSGPSGLNGRVLRVDQRLYAGGRLEADLQGAAARRDSAVYGVRESALALALQIVGGYQALVTANAQLGAIDGYRKKLDELDGTITRRIEAGVSASADRSLMNARMAQSRNDQAAARAASRSATTSLERLVGDATSVAALEPVLEQGTSPLPSAVCRDDGLADARLGQALAAHPALARIERDIDAGRAEVDAQRAGTRPAIGLRIEQPIAPHGDAALRSTRVSIVLQYAPDAGLSSLSRTDSASARVASLVNQADALKREVIQQIRSECVEQAATIDRISGFGSARGYTTEVLASSTRLFVAGRRGWVDLLNAARETSTTSRPASLPMPRCSARATGSRC